MAKEKALDIVDEAGRESFPASDPPVWTLGPRRREDPPLTKRNRPLAHRGEPHLMDDNLTTARAYLAAIEGGVARDQLAQFFAPGFVQHEYPNRLNPHGAERDLETVLDGHETGKQLMQRQRFAIVNEIAAADAVALEVQWTGVLATPAAGLAAGDEMRAHFAVFLIFRDGKIVAQRNYDCFQPW